MWFDKMAAAAPALAIPERDSLKNFARNIRTAIEDGAPCSASCPFAQIDIDIDILTHAHTSTSLVQAGLKSSDSPRRRCPGIIGERATSGRARIGEGGCHPLSWAPSHSRGRFVEESEE